MAQTLDNIKGGGGSIKIGAVGTIGALMTRELESAYSTSQPQSNSRSRPQSVPCGATPRKLQARRTVDDAGSSSSKISNNLTLETPRISKSYGGSSRQVLSTSLDGTPSRERINKKGTQLVDIVDVKCGNPHKSWVNPVANRLKKLGFAKLPETIM